MQVTATEFKLNMGKYLDMVSQEDIWITRHGKPIAKVINPNVSSVDLISGILKDKVPEGTNHLSILRERMEKYEIND